MKWPVLRDVTLFFGGIAGVLHETLLSRTERPSLLILFAAMMGLPAFLQSPTFREEERVTEARHKARLRRRLRDEKEESE